MVALVLGNVIVVESVPVSAIELLAVSVLPLAMVNVAELAGAVIVTLFTDVAVATPMFGVVKVGDVPKTKAPEPVSSVTAAARLAEDGVPKKVRIPEPVVVELIAVEAPPPTKSELAARVPDWVTIPPVVLTALPTAVTTPVPVVVVEGATPAPPPITSAFAANAPEEASVVVPLK